MSWCGRVLTVLAVTLLLSPAAGAEPGKKVGRAILTYYWIVEETEPQYSGSAALALRDARGRVIAQTSRKFRRALVREGTGWLRDGRVVTYDRKVDGEHRFRVIRTRYGIGASGCSLVPYRSVAVDPRFVKLGSTIYVPQLKGAHLPDGTIHDGIFLAADRGHFRGAHIDVFVGLGVKGARPFTRHGYHSRSHITAYLVDSDTDDCRR